MVKNLFVLIYYKKYYILFINVLKIFFLIITWAIGVYYTMKLRHLLTGTILTVSLLAGHCRHSLCSSAKGRFETVNSTTISGWAYNSSTPDDALNVRISIKDKNTGKKFSPQRMTAGEYSDELYGSGKGNGCHAFTLSMDWSSRPMAYIW